MQTLQPIQKVLQARLPVLPHPYLTDGQRVRIMSGPLAGAEGILMFLRPEKGIVVLSVDLLRRSIAVEIDCSSSRCGIAVSMGRLLSVNPSPSHARKP